VIFRALAKVMGFAKAQPILRATRCNTSKDGINWGDIVDSILDPGTNTHDNRSQKCSA
jgi:hypothetical protein